MSVALEGEELRRVLRDVQEKRADDELSVTPSDDDTVVATSGEDMGYRIDVVATASRILERGRQGNPIAALGDHLAATFGTVTVEPVDGLDDEVFQSWLEDNADQLSTPPFVGGVEFDGSDVTPLYPEAGIVLVESELESKAVAATRSPGEDSITVSTEEAKPTTTRGRCRRPRRNGRKPCIRAGDSDAPEWGPDDCSRRDRRRCRM